MSIVFVVNSLLSLITSTQTATTEEDHGYARIVNCHDWQSEKEPPLTSGENRMSNYDRRLLDRRSPAEGQSLSQSTSSETQTNKLRIKGLTNELEKAQEEKQILEAQFEQTRIEWLQTETKLLEKNRALTSDNDYLRSEIAKLKQQKSYHQQSGGSPPSLHGTPHLDLELSGIDHSSSSSRSDNQQIQFVQQFVVPRLKTYKMKLTDLSGRLKREKERVSTLTKQLETSKHKGVYRNIPSSMDTSYSTNLGLSGPPTSNNLNLTFSLASSSDRSTKGATYQPSSPSDRYPLYRQDATEKQQPSGSEHRFNRAADPVESSDHVYANNAFYRQPENSMYPGDANPTAEGSVFGTIKKSTGRAPVPVPRARGLKSLGSSLSSRLVAETLPHHVENIDIGEKGMADVSGTSSRRSPPSPTGTMDTGVAGNSSPPSGSNTYSPTLTPRQYGSDRRIDQVCDVCHTNFPVGVPRQVFLDHCLECAEKAADAEEGVNHSALLTSQVVGTESRVCPICQQRFDEDVPQTDFENHVHSHFVEDGGNLK